MPKSIEKKYSRRHQVNPQQTFDFTVPKKEVNARMVDTYTEPTVSSKTKNVLSFINSMSSLAKTTSQFSQIYNAEMKEKGYISGAKKEEAPKGKHWAFIEGYEGFKGEAASGEYLAKMQGLIREASTKELTPKDWDIEKEKIHEGFLNGATDAFIKGFIPKASGIEEKFDAEFVKILQTKLETNYLSETRKKAISDLTVIYNDVTIEDKGKAMREVLTQEHNRGKNLNIADKIKISTEFVETIIEKAVTDGRPDYLDFAKIKDKDGVKLIDRPELADEIWSGLRSAMSKKETLEIKAIEERKNKIKEIKENIERQIVWSLETDDLNPAIKNISQYKSILDPDDLSKYMRRANELSLDANWSKVNNAEWYRLAHKKASVGKMTEEDWNNAPKFLTRAGYIELSKVNNKGKEEMAKDSWGMRSKFEQKKKRLLENISPIHPITKKFFDAEHGKERYEFADDSMDLLYEDFVRKNGVEALGIEQMIKWRNDVRKEALELYPIVMDISAMTSKTASTNQNPNTGNTQKTVNLQNQNKILSLKNRLDVLKSSKNKE